MENTPGTQTQAGESSVGGRVSDIQVGSEVLATAEPSSEGRVNEVPAVIEVSTSLLCDDA